MKPEVRPLPSDKVLQELAKLFMIEAHDRHVYCVFGPYGRLCPFQRRLDEEVNKGSFNTRGQVKYISLNREIDGS